MRVELDGRLPPAARREYLTWIRSRALTMYARAGRELAADLAPWELRALGDRLDRPDVDDWIRGAAFEAADVFATDLTTVRPGLVRRALRALSRALWALSL